MMHCRHRLRLAALRGLRELFAQQGLLTLTLIAATGGALSAGPPVAPTDALSPQDELAKFHLPPGFAIQLVASEPDIQKPMNLNFDAQGRLWVTHSTEYPFPAENGTTARDGVTILDGIGPDGKARHITRFADKLNIPIGVVPLDGGASAIVWSIPYLWKLRDTNGDGAADEREILFGPYDFVDTHGDQNSLKLGTDGWVYACHGFRNASKIRRKGVGDVVLELQSGNTYRFRPDGSEIEQFSWGQVNPFGSCFDPFGNFYVADCHSKPVSLVLRGGYLESFGKPHDGLGFTPPITGNDHGSTGIAGAVYYDALQFPTEYRGSLFVGNVVTNRVHRDVFHWRGSTPWIDRPEDFLVCDDWWFHPVDLQLGPDGALYIADFYNCIIGHYEVDLKHPRRDRLRGRIWRVVWQGLDGQTPAPATGPNLVAASSADVWKALDDANLAVRTLATNELARRKIDPAQRPAAGQQSHASPRQAIGATWLAVRRGCLEMPAPHEPAWAEPVVRANWLRAAAESPRWDEAAAAAVRLRLNDVDPQVRRIAAEALACHPALAHIPPLVKLWNTSPPDDSLLVYAVKIAVRNSLQAEQELAQLAEFNLSSAERAKLAEVALAVPTAAAAWFTFKQAQSPDSPPDLLSRCLTHAARYVDAAQLGVVAKYVQQKYPDDVGRQLPLFAAIDAGLSQRGIALDRSSPLGQWGAALTAAVLTSESRTGPAWTVHPLENAPGGQPFQNPWGVRQRNCADGAASVLFFDSIVHGERLTGVLRSAPFTIPESLSFWLCGHNGHPGATPAPVNHVRLKLAAGGEEIARQVPPRNDVAQKVTWNLKPWAGRQGVLEVIDADAGTAYAWLAVSRFNPPVVGPPSADFAGDDSELTLAVKLVDKLKLAPQLPQVTALLTNRETSPGLRIAAAQAVMHLDAAGGSTAFAQIISNPAEPAALRAQAGQALGAINSPGANAALAAALAGAPATLEQAYALALAGSASGLEVLLDAIAAGKASARLLQDPPIIERMKPRLDPARAKRAAELTSRLPPADQRVRQLIAQRLANHAGSGAAIEKGAAVFKTHCAACHKIGDVGQKVGPQLDGIGQRGAERLLEDVLDPNRNVDGAFRATIIVTQSGLTITGLKLRDEGQVTVLVDSQGKEQRIAQAEIDESQISPISPMPSNLADAIPEADLHHLLAFLLSQQPPATAPPPAR